jgi:hypothetical protein
MSTKIGVTKETKHSFEEQIVGIPKSGFFKIYCQTPTEGV